MKKLILEKELLLKVYRNKNNKQAIVMLPKTRTNPIPKKVKVKW